ncbi:flagellar hook-basal body complex protein FliE [Marinisporobacter balticus]|uniref:Flagellar hook-basal body complex protein FliE n=1 Tax=Marinisporobacter balticus TaxID=2018667 RepID=A0A4R2L0M3_9FIRM|nr:flagellar hook-basal body complex protein FliE [Marinisporobacter balticus]TCO79954.1 flagellar hook-basal body complex protein FliE [Marinisporobacter balticus]
MKINNITNPTVQSFNINDKKEENNFSTFLKNAINEVNDYELASQKLGTQAAMGEIENIQEVMIATEKSEIALQFTMEIKNKVLDAYKEIMRLQV